MQLLGWPVHCGRRLVIEGQVFVGGGSRRRRRGAAPEFTYRCVVCGRSGYREVFDPEGFPPRRPPFIRRPGQRYAPRP